MTTTITVNKDQSGSINWGEGVTDFFQHIGADALNMMGDLSGRDQVFSFDDDDGPNFFIQGTTLLYDSEGEHERR